MHRFTTCFLQYLGAIDFSLWTHHHHLSNFFVFLEDSQGRLSVLLGQWPECIRRDVAWVWAVSSFWVPAPFQCEWPLWLWSIPQKHECTTTVHRCNVRNRHFWWKFKCFCIIIKKIGGTVEPLFYSWDTCFGGLFVFSYTVWCGRKHIEMGFVNHRFCALGKALNFLCLSGLFYRMCFLPSWKAHPSEKPE